MAEVRTFYRPRVSITIGGRTAGSWLGLQVSSGAGLIKATLDVPKSGESPLGKAVTIRLDAGSGEELVFTGVVADVESWPGKRRCILHPVVSRALDERVESASWRQETSGNIAREILASEDNPFDSDLAEWPDVELSRFSLPGGTRRWGLQALISAVEQAAGVSISRVVGPDGVLYLGPLDRIRWTADSRVAVQSGVNVITQAGANFHTHALPVSYNQVVSVDNADRLCTGAHLDIRPGYYRADLILEAL